MAHPGQPDPLAHEPRAKATNPLVWVGIGCGVLIFGMIAAAAAAFVLVRQAAQGGVHAAGSFSAGVEVTIDGGAVSIDAGVSTGVPPSSGSGVGR
jgi:hypothetical protein